MICAGQPLSRPGSSAAPSRRSGHSWSGAAVTLRCGRMLRPECGICLPQIRYGTDNGLERIMEVASDCGCSKRRVSCPEGRACPHRCPLKAVCDHGPVASRGMEWAVAAALAVAVGPRAVPCGRPPAAGPCCGPDGQPCSPAGPWPGRWPGWHAVSTRTRCPCRNSATMRKPGSSRPGWAICSRTGRHS